MDAPLDRVLEDPASSHVVATIANGRVTFRR
jgi:hypothetical protein